MSLSDLDVFGTQKFWTEFTEFCLTSIEQWPRTGLVLMRRYRNPWQWECWWRL